MIRRSRRPSGRPTRLRTSCFGEVSPKLATIGRERRRNGLHYICMVALAALVGVPAQVRADDRWFARDKAEHFGATAALGAGGYGLASTVAERERWRVAAGIGAGIGAAAAKELWDRSHAGDASWRDLSWGAVGTATGVTIAWAIDRLRHRQRRAPAVHPRMNHAERAPIG